MPHFAKIENGIVTMVVVGRSEDDGQEFRLSERTGDVYKQTSYNTHGGVHYDHNTNEPSADQGKAFRKNYAGIGFTYDAQRDAFIPPQPYPSWILDEQTCLWNSPVPYPEDGEMYVWDENLGAWRIVTREI